MEEEDAVTRNILFSISNEALYYQNKNVTIQTQKKEVDVFLSDVNVERMSHESINVKKSYRLFCCSKPEIRKCNKFSQFYKNCWLSVFINNTAMALMPLRRQVLRMVVQYGNYSTLLQRSMAYKSAVSLETLYPNSSLKLTTPSFVSII